MFGRILCFFGWHHPVVDKNQFVATMAKLLATDHPGGETLVVDAYCKRCRKPMKRCDCDVDPVPPIVIDPFSGSGTVGVVAKRLQRKYILIDLNAEYNEIAEDRLKQTELAL